MLESSEYKADYFIPGDYVPISPFYCNVKSGDVLEFKPEANMLAFYKENSVAVFCMPAVGGEPITFRVNKSECSYELSAKTEGDYVFICSELKNEFPIATHWKNKNGKGAMLRGGNDGCGRIFYNNETGQNESELDLYDENPDSPYTYNTDKYELLGGDKVPSHNNYVGMNYSIFSVDEEAAIYLSQVAYSQTGFPIRFTNAVPERPAPCFTVVNALPVNHEQNESLASYVLPPFWQKGGDNKYPLFFSGYYDIHENIYVDFGKKIFKMIFDSFKETGTWCMYTAWNGGGAKACRTVQRQACFLLNALFDRARLLGADTRQIVAWGGSRGGISALLAAANPEASGYSIARVIAFNPPLSIPWIKQIDTYTYPMIPGALKEDTGYKNAGSESFVDENGRSGAERFLFNHYGEDIGGREVEFSLFDEKWTKQLIKAKTQVFLYDGTHDIMGPSHIYSLYACHLRRSGVPVHYATAFCLGHNNGVDIFKLTSEIMSSLIKGVNISSNDSYYRKTGDINNWGCCEEFYPDEYPFYLEMPKLIPVGRPIQMLAAGPEHTVFRIWLYSMAKKTKQLLYEGALGRGIDEISLKPAYKRINAVPEIPLLPGVYEYEVELMRKGANDFKKESMETSQPFDKGRCFLTVCKNDEYLNKSEKRKINDHFVGWGLIEKL